MSRRTALSTITALTCAVCAPACSRVTPDEASASLAVQPAVVETHGSMPATRRMARLRALQKADGFAFERQGDGALAAKVGPKGSEATATLEGERIAIAPADERFALGLRTRGVGRRGHLASEPLARTSAEGQELILAHSSFEERDLAGPLGLEQTFSLASRPAGEGPLVVEVAFDGLTPRKDRRDPDRVDLVDDRGATRAIYRDLAASDATGRDLDAHLEVTGASARLVIDDEGARYPVVIDPLIVTGPQVLTGELFDAFGLAVAVDGDTAVVGAPERGYPGAGGHSDSGAVDIYVRAGDTWTLQQEITAPMGSGDFFGSSVAVSGDTLIVGPYADTGYYCEGNVYVFARSGSTWSLQQELAEDDGFDCFGQSVSVEGDTALIGASNGYDYNYDQPGAAFVFSRTGTHWTKQQTLTSGKTGIADAFGSSVSLHGDTLLVAASGEGRVYAFRLSGTSWTPEQELSVPGKPLTSVSLGDDTALVGVGTVDEDAGAYVFARSGSVWSAQQALGVNANKAYSAVGPPVSLSGDVAVVKTRAYLRSGTSWVEQPPFFSPAHPNQLDGLSVSLSGKSLFVGAPTKNPNNSFTPQYPSEVYVYTLSGSGSGSGGGGGGGGGGVAGGAGGGGGADGGGHGCALAPAGAPLGPRPGAGSLLALALALLERRRRDRVSRR